MGRVPVFVIRVFPDLLDIVAVAIVVDDLVILVVDLPELGAVHVPDPATATTTALSGVTLATALPPGVGAARVQVLQVGPDVAEVELAAREADQPPAEMNRI